MMTKNDFELLCAAAALAGLRNPREGQYLHQVQDRAQVVADAYEQRGFFELAGDDGTQAVPGRYAPQGLPGAGVAKKAPVVHVGTGRPGTGASSKRAVVVNQTMVAPGRGAPPPTVNQNQQRGTSTPQHQTSNTAPKPKIVNPRTGPMAIVGGSPLPRITEAAAPLPTEQPIEEVSDAAGPDAAGQ